jgi:Tfp pilus assembly protein PilW
VSRTIVYLLIALCFPAAASASDKYCTYFGGVNDSMKMEDISMYQLEKDGCTKGDALHIIIYDRSKVAKGRETMYLANEIAQLCDTNLPIAIVGQVASGNLETGALHAVCTYAGKRRLPRVKD